MEPSTPELTALYERILALVPADELQESFNSVLRDEISTLRTSVDGVAAAFAKLEEVRHAVNKLEHGNGPVSGRSASLLQVMDSTMELQRELEKALERAVSEISDANKKRKRVEDKTVVKRGMIGRKTAENMSKDPTTSYEKNESTEVSSVKGEKGKAGELQMDTRSEDDAGNSSRAFSMTPANCLEVMRMVTQLSVLERNQHVPGVLAKLEKIVPDQSEPNRVSILKYVILWANFSAGLGSNLAVYGRFNEAMEKLIEQLPKTDGLVGMKRLNDSLTAFLKKQHASAKSHITPGSQRKDIRLSYELLVWRVNAMAPEKRHQHTQEVVNALSDQMSCGENAVQFRELAKAVKTVGQWARSDPMDEAMHKPYRELAVQVKRYAEKLDNFGWKIDLHREVGKLEAVTNNSPHQDVQVKTDKLQRLTRKLKQQATTASIDSCIMALDDVIRHQQKGWNPRTNPVVCECYQLLAQKVKGLARTTRQQRTAVMKKWRI
ncbi:uncharacterized protein IUM83_10096 [Phytophthora cinnamomi]|uniref:uncharacterized protein n=1 Tax=Phytophthora cinnamomi TaxID=4785 RepID=UPI00355AAAFD|nr:hypothetical protein IUM83_10096 [Phytophthora cinnamomi]